MAFQRGRRRRSGDLGAGAAGWCAMVPITVLLLVAVLGWLGGVEGQSSESLENNGGHYRFASMHWKHLGNNVCSPHHLALSQSIWAYQSGASGLFSAPKLTDLFRTPSMLT